MRPFGGPLRVSWTGWELVIAAAATGFAFISSAWVNAISRLTHARARRLAEQDPRRGGILARMAQNPRPFVASTLLAMLLARVAAVVLVADVLLGSSVPAPGVVAIAVMTFVLFEFAELAPRAWVLQHPDRVMLVAARPVWLLGAVLRPLASLLIGANRVFMLILPGRGMPRGPLTSEEEIMSMLEVAESEDVIERQERQMITSIFEFGDTVVREVMVPRPDMVCVDAAAPLTAVLDLMLDEGYSRLPVIRGAIDDLAGIVHARDVMQAVRAGSGRDPATTVMRDAFFVPELKKVAALLRELQAAKLQMAVVVDEYGGTAGLVSMEDLLEEIVGEITDEHDHEEAPVERIDDHTLLVTPRVGVEELGELLAVDLPHSDWDSVGGLVAGTLGRVPNQGDRVRLDGVELEVERMDGRRIGRILVHSLPAQAGGEVEGDSAPAEPA